MFSTIHTNCMRRNHDLWLLWSSDNLYLHPGSNNFPSMQKSTILKMSQLPDMLCLLLKTNRFEPASACCYLWSSGWQRRVPFSLSCLLPCYFSQGLAILICPTNLSARQGTAALNFQCCITIILYWLKKVTMMEQELSWAAYKIRNKFNLFKLQSLLLYVFDNQNKKKQKATKT